MAKKNASSFFADLSNKNELNPNGYDAKQAVLYQVAQDQMGQSFAAKHPILNGVGNAALGAALYGPTGLVLGPMMAKTKEQRRQAGIAEAYRNSVKTLAEVENQLNPVRTNNNIGNTTSAVLQNAGIQSPITENTPINNEFAQTLMNGVTGLDTYDQLLNDQNAQFKKTWNMASGVAEKMINRKPDQPPAPAPSGQPAPMMGQGQMDASEQPQVLNGTASRLMPPPPTRLATYANPELLKTGLSNNASILNNTFQNVPAYMKLPSDIKEKLAEVALKNAQTSTEQQRPALVQAQTRNENSGASLKDRTDPNLRAPNIIDLMTPEQRAQYAAVTASGQNKPMTAADGINLLKLQNAAGEKDWAGNPTPTAVNAQAVLNRMQSGGFAGQGASRTTSGNVSNGQTKRAQTVLNKILGNQ